MNRRALYVLLSIVPWLDIEAKVVKIQSLSDYYDQPARGYRPVFRARKNGPVRAYGDHFVPETVKEHAPNKTYKRTNEKDGEAAITRPPAAETQPEEAGAETSSGRNTDPIKLTLKTDHQTSPKDKLAANAEKFLTTKCTTGHGEKKSAENNIDETTKPATFTDQPNSEPAPSNEETPSTSPDPSTPDKDVTQDTRNMTTTRDPYEPPVQKLSAEFYSDDE